MYINVVRDVHSGMPKQPGENLDVDSFVIAVCRKSVPEHMLSLVKDVSSLAQALCLPSECLVRKPLPIVARENQSCSVLAFSICRRETASGVSGMVRLLDSLLAQFCT